MNYTDAFQEQMNKYTELRAEYDRLVQDPQFLRITTRMPFEMLRAKQVFETLQVFSELAKKPVIRFNSTEEAEVLAKDISRFSNEKNTDALLNDALCLNKVATVSEQINALVNSTPYLNNTLCVFYDKSLAKLAYDCLELIPKIKQYTTYQFRYRFVESCLYSLDEAGIDTLVRHSVLKVNDVDNVYIFTNPTTAEQQNYEKNLQRLCTITNRKMPVLETLKVKLKGVSFKSADNSQPRQEALKKLMEAKEAGQRIILETQEYIYENEAKKTSEPAIRVLWNKMDIGSVPADVVKSIKSTYIAPVVTAELASIHFNSLYYGEIFVHIKAKDKIAPAVETAKEAPAVEEPKAEETKETEKAE